MPDKRQEKRRQEDSPKAAVSSSLAPEFAVAQERAFRDALQVMIAKNVPFAVSGAFAIHEHTGIWRNTKDLDLFLATDHLLPALGELKKAGFETEVRDPIWLGKAWRDGYFIDLITGMSNAIIQVDQSWIDRAIWTEVAGVQAPLLAAEELIASKIFVTRRERFDGADVAHLIYATRDSLDWDRVFQLVGDHWEILLWSLIFYRYIYPRHAHEVPRPVWHRLLDLFENSITNPSLNAPFRGSLIDENMFAIDVKEWGLENEIERYRDEHRRLHREHHKSAKDEPAA
jgi:hypothetical protein